MAHVASRRIMLLCLPRRLRDALHGVPSHYFAATIVVIAMDNGDMTTSILFICLYKLRLCAAAAPATMERFFFLALACRGTFPRVSQVCANVRKVAGGHCTLGGVRMMEASVFLRSP